MLSQKCSYLQEESGERLGDDSHCTGLLPSQYSLQVLLGGLPVETRGTPASEQGGELRG